MPELDEHLPEQLRHSLRLFLRLLRRVLLERDESLLATFDELLDLMLVANYP